MDTRSAYNSWSQQYDSNDNKTRDLEAYALRECLQSVSFDNCLEIGCGTGKNTVWLIEKGKHVTAVDLSEEMLAKAKQKIRNPGVVFKQADINTAWNFTDRFYDLITFSLVLEHIENLENIFEKASQQLVNGGYIYIGELHPFKQYLGSKARFENADGLHIVECFTHHISDFIQAAKKSGLGVIDIHEYFDEGKKDSVPRILVIRLKKFF